MRVTLLFCILVLSFSGYAQQAVRPLPEYIYVAPATDKYSWERIVHVKGRTILHNVIACSDSMVFSFGGFEWGSEGACGPVVKQLNYLKGRHLLHDTMHYPSIGFSENIFFIRDSLMFLGGGRDTCLAKYGWNDFWQYNLNTHTWKRLGDLPFYYAYKPNVFKDGNRTLVFIPRLEGKDFERVNPVIYEYNMATDKWMVFSKALPPFAELVPEGCAGASHHQLLWPTTFFLDHHIYVLFQITDNMEKRPGCTSTFYECNAATGEWTKLPPFPGYLESFAFAVSDGVYGYIGGGYAFSRSERREVYRYDPELAKWERITNLPVGTVYGVGWNFDGQTYVGFGKNEDEHTITVWRMKYKRK